MMQQNPSDNDVQFGMLQFLLTAHERGPDKAVPLSVLLDVLSLDQQRGLALLRDLCDQDLAEQEADYTRFRITASGVNHCRAILARIRPAT